MTNAGVSLYLYPISDIKSALTFANSLDISLPYLKVTTVTAILKTHAIN